MGVQRSARIMAAFVGSSLSLLGAASAIAAPAEVSVVNLGQPGMVSAVSQPALSVSARGACDSPFDAAQANGAASPCGTSPWPAPDSAEWAPLLQAAGGDTVELRFSELVERASVVATTRFPVGLSDPDHVPVPNREIVPTQAAEPTDDPAVWHVVLSRLPRTTATFSIVAGGARDVADFALGLTTPRFSDTATFCGQYFANTGETGYECNSAGFPPGLPIPPTGAGQPAPNAAPTAGPLVKPLAKLRIKIGQVVTTKSRLVRVRVSTSAAATLTTRAVYRGKTISRSTRNVSAGASWIKLSRAASSRRGNVRIVISAHTKDGRAVTVAAVRRIQ